MRARRKSLTSHANRHPAVNEKCSGPRPDPRSRDHRRSGVALAAGNSRPVRGRVSGGNRRASGVRYPAVGLRAAFSPALPRLVRLSESVCLSERHTCRVLGAGESSGERVQDELDAEGGSDRGGGRRHAAEQDRGQDRPDQAAHVVPDQLPGVALKVPRRADCRWAAETRSAAHFDRPHESAQGQPGAQQLVPWRCSPAQVSLLGSLIRATYVLLAARS